MVRTYSIILAIIVISTGCTTWEDLTQKADFLTLSGDYANAMKFSEKAVKNAGKKWGRGSVNYASAIDQLGFICYKSGIYNKADSLYKAVLKVKVEIFGNDHPEYASTLYHSALLCHRLGKFSEAESQYLKALEICKKEPDINQSDYLELINSMAYFYLEQGDLEKSEEFAADATKILSKSFRESDPIYASGLDNFAIILIFKGDYEKAEPLILRSLSIKRQAYGESHPDYAMTIDNYGIIQHNMGNYAKAESLYNSAEKIRLKKLGPLHPDYATTLNNRGMLYDDMGNYAKAEPFYRAASEIWKRIPEHPDYATSLNNLAYLYDKIGDYERAEPLYIKSMNLTKERLGTDHQYYAYAVINLGYLYWEMGNYTKAEPLYVEGAELMKKLLGPDHPDVATSLNNLAALYQDMGKNSRAEALYIEALNITGKSLGKEHPDYATSLNNLALLYMETEEYKKSETLCREAMGIQKRVLGTSHPFYAFSITTLADLYQTTGKFLKAEPLYLEAVAILKKALGPDHPKFAISLNRLASIYQDLGNFQKAEEFYLHANENVNKQMSNSFNFLSEKEKEQFLKNVLNYYFDEYNSFFFRRKKQNPAITGASYDNELAHKGILLLSNTVLRKIINGSGDTSLISMYEKFTDIQKQLSLLYSTPGNERNENPGNLEKIANELEKELISKGKSLRGVESLKGSTGIKWQDVQRSLKPGEAAIEFVSFRYYNSTLTDSIFYCALVLCNDYPFPKMVYLFEEKQLHKLISTPEATGNIGYISRLYSNKSANGPIIQGKEGNNLFYKLIWEPIDSLLQGIHTVSIAPTGLLHKVSFSAIPLSDNSLLSDKYILNIVSSTRVIAAISGKDAVISSGDEAALYGGIEYDIDSSEMISTTRQYPSDRSFVIPRNVRGITWSYLPGTFTEVTKIQNILKAHDIKNSMYTREKATEESFINLPDRNHSPEIIHLATHGFFFPDLEKKTESFKTGTRKISLDKPVFIQSQNPLLRSGILLTGAGRVWQNATPVEGIEDGTLTAFEVSGLNLSNTKLVVLSACETGLGDISRSEGVYGLHRAFKMAGVQYLLTSLWQVPDYQTAELMQLFYENCFKDLTIQEAFRNAQLTMRRKYDPYYWAAFVLQE